MPSSYRIVPRRGLHRRRRLQSLREHDTVVRFFFHLHDITMGPEQGLGCASTGIQPLFNAAGGSSNPSPGGSNGHPCPFF